MSQDRPDQTTRTSVPSDRSRATAPPRSRSRDLRLVAMAVFAVLLIWFAVDNTQTVDIHFWVTTAKGPLIGVVAISAALAAAISALLLRRHQIRRKH